MIHETGHIAEVSDDAVWVECASRSNCQRCAEGRGCGGAIMGRLLGDGQHRLQVVCVHDAPRVGEEVSVALDEAIVLRGALLAYCGPLAGLLLGALSGQLLGGEAVAIVGGGAGLLLACAIARLLARHYFSDMQPVARLQ